MNAKRRNTEKIRVFNIEFNASKSKLLVFGKKPPKVDIIFQNMLISQVERKKHVGNIMCSSHLLCEQS